MTVLMDEGWTAEDLEACSTDELRDLIRDMDPYADPMHATRADMVAFLLGDARFMPKSNVDVVCEGMLREAARFRRWVRGVPPWHACITPRDMSWLYQHDLPAIWERAAY